MHNTLEYFSSILSNSPESSSAEPVLREIAENLEGNKFCDIKNRQESVLYNFMDILDAYNSHPIYRILFPVTDKYYQLLKKKSKKNSEEWLYAEKGLLKIEYDKVLAMESETLTEHNIKSQELSKIDYQIGVVSEKLSKIRPETPVDEAQEEIDKLELEIGFTDDENEKGVIQRKKSGKEIAKWKKEEGAAEYLPLNCISEALNKSSEIVFH